LFSRAKTRVVVVDGFRRRVVAREFAIASSRARDARKD